MAKKKKTFSWDGVTSIVSGNKNEINMTHKSTDKLGLRKLNNSQMGSLNFV